jgi:hypothetical protein
VRDRPGPGFALHQDVASYALGVLDDAEAARFEEHLADCDACAEQLESLLPVVGLLPEVPLSTVDLPPRPIGHDDEGKHRRRRTGLRGPVRLVSAAGAGLRRPAVAAAAAAIAAVAATAGVFGEFGHDEIVTTSAGAPVSAAASPWDGLRGPDLEHGVKLAATDPATGVLAEVVLEAAPWGTKVSFAVSGLDGPQNCRLVVLRRDGGTELLSSWVVPAGGYGVGSQPRPLVLQAATALNRAQIAGLRVEAVDHDATTPLVTVSA